MKIIVNEKEVNTISLYFVLNIQRLNNVKSLTVLYTCLKLHMLPLLYVLLYIYYQN